ncbi:hypothetical protein MAFF212519_08400 [Clavibacter michiganensis]
MALRTIDSLGDLRGRRVIVRCDLNVPLKDGVIGDDGRIRASLGTLTGLREAGARVVVISHLGRPDGTPDDKYSLRPVAARLGELLGADVAFASDTVGDSARAAVERSATATSSCSRTSASTRRRRARTRRCAVVSRSRSPS